MSEFLLSNGDLVTKSQQAFVLHFNGSRRVLSTSALNGGVTTALTAAFNYNLCVSAGVCREMLGKNLCEHHQSVAAELGLDPALTTGMSTAANIDNMAVVRLSHGDITVTALVTAGVDVNAMRAGDPATLHEKAGEAYPAGTINSFVVIDADVSEGALAEALMVAAEAKAAALQELAVAGKYTRGLATGTGTDGIIIICNNGVGAKLLNAGKHFKLGELIGKAVKKAVKDSLYRQSGLCGGLQHSVLGRMSRFGVTREAIKACFFSAANCDEDRIDRWIDKIDRDGFAVNCAALYAHLLDELDWGLLPPGETADMADELLALLFRHYECEYKRRTESFDNLESSVIALQNAFLEAVTELLIIHRDAETKK